MGRVTRGHRDIKVSGLGLPHTAGQEQRRGKTGWGLGIGTGGRERALTGAPDKKKTGLRPRHVGRDPPLRSLMQPASVSLL